jgi:cystathionine beta-lyase
VSNPLTQLSLDQLRRRTSEKWQRYPPDVLPVWVAEMDVTLPEAVVAALERALHMGDTGYATGTTYHEAFTDFAAWRWGWTPDPDHMRLVPDVMLGVVEVLKLVTGAGDAVVVNPPVYPPFYDFITHMDRRVVTAPLDDQHRLDLAALAAAFVAARAGGRPAAYLLCSPHNPTGTVHTRAELGAVAAVAREHGVRVVADEIHAPLVLAGATHVPYLSVRGAEGGFALLSASKAWNLAGLKVALAAAGPEAAHDLARMPEEVGHGAGHLAIIGHVAALQHGRAWLAAVLAQLDANRRLLGELLATRLPGVRSVPPAATYLAWLDCRSLGVGDDPAAVFFEHGRVALTSGRRFGPGGAGHARFNFGSSPAVITEAVNRMATALERFDSPSPTR